MSDIKILDEGSIWICLLLAYVRVSRCVLLNDILLYGRGNQVYNCDQLCAHMKLLLLLCLGLYGICTVVPDQWLQFIGFVYLPSKLVSQFLGRSSIMHCIIFLSFFFFITRYWIVALPVYLMVLIVTLLVMYSGYSMLITPSLANLKTINGKLIIS